MFYWLRFSFGQNGLLMLVHGDTCVLTFQWPWLFPQLLKYIPTTFSQLTVITDDENTADWKISNESSVRVWVLIFIILYQFC